MASTKSVMDSIGAGNDTDCYDEYLQSITMNSNSMSSMNSKIVEMKSSNIDGAGDEETDFYSSGDLNLTLTQQERSWIDPWEVSPSHGLKYYEKHLLSPSKETLTKSIQPNNVSSPSSSSPSHASKRGSAAYQSFEPLLKHSHKSSMLPTPKKFGAYDGVMAGCLLNIFGVIMFLRIGWIIGQSGILYTLVIMCMSTLITMLTTLSMSAICTNGTIKAGGAYYIISRTLGPAFGGSVGMLLSIGNMIAISLYLIGFAETLVDNLHEDANFTITNDPVNDVRIWANILLIFVLILALIGLKYVIRAQLGLLAFICFAILTLVIGSVYQTKDCSATNGDSGEQCALYGYQGWIDGNFQDNLYPQYTQDWNFWSVLAIFFPAVTGIMAGANISGDLRNPSSDIPKGTLTAIIVSSATYMILAMIVGAVASRNELISNVLIMADICVWDYIVYLGVYAATLSSAIASLVGAPRILMAIADDNIIRIPGLAYFAKADKYGNPIRGYFLSFLVAFGFNCIGELNVIAPLLSQFFIIVYLLINFACFVMEISRNPGWRPSFKYYSKYTALLGSLACLSVMFLLNHWYATGTIFISFALYVFISWTDPICDYGASFYSYSVYRVYRNLLGLALKSHKTDSSVVWRPAFLLVTFSKFNNEQMINFVETLRKDHSLLFCVNIIIGDYRSNLVQNAEQSKAQHDHQNNSNHTKNKNKLRQRTISGYLPIKEYKQKRTKLKGVRSLGFNNVVTSDSYRNGLQSTLQLCGLGVLRPNILILNSIDINDDHNGDIQINEYVECVRDALLSELGVMICCGLDDKVDFGLRLYEIKKHAAEHNDILDVWYMADDGGLTMLLPYIMVLCTFWSKLKVRINIVTDRVNDDEWFSNESNNIKEMVTKFRLPYDSNPRIIFVKTNEPNPVTVSRFETLSQCDMNSITRKHVVSRWLRLSELIGEHSRESALLIVTLPVPSRFVQPLQYMAIVNILSDQAKLPPMILVRGNGKQIITFHSE